MLQRCCLQPMFSGCVVSFVGESTPTLLGDELGPFAIQSVSTVSVASGQKIKKWPLPNYCRALLSIFDSSFVGICLTSTLTSTLHPHLHPSLRCIHSYNVVVFILAAFAGGRGPA